MELTRLTGFQDLIGQPARTLAYVEERARALMERYAVGEIRIPLLERIELYQRSTGETSDIVSKQMYTFTDRDEAGTTLALRPEGTPGVVRAYVEAGLDRSDPEQRLFYSGPMFRRERPQKGRYRQFHQFGVEVFGRADPACDAELLVMIDDLRRDLGLSFQFEINSLGDAKCRPAFRAALLDYGRAHYAELCDDCHERLERNPLRMLDCKIDVKLAAAAPKSLDFLCPECRQHFDTVVALLSSAGVEFIINPRIVRGLDYYMRTAFEVTSTNLGSQNAVVAGGRYDGLVEVLGGSDIPGIGFAIGMERMALALEAAQKPREGLVRVALIALGEPAARRATQLARELRGLPMQVELLSTERSLKSQLKRADRIGANYAVIIGADELARDAAQLRDLGASAQREVRLTDLAAELYPARCD
ncbi:MAG TPA: histidine--tRNA ligase [Candidatus Binataceae bacterium]|nr:histidine--tRNA ligase [Candidatus Binataceae bacterium]